MQHTAVNLLKTSWTPSNSWNFIQLSHSTFIPVLLSLWKNLISSWPLVSATVPVIERSLNKADQCMCSAMARKKIKLKEEAISEILVADTDLESGAEASNVEEKSEEEKEEQQQQ